MLGPEPVHIDDFRAVCVQQVEQCLAQACVGQVLMEGRHIAQTREEDSSSPPPRLAAGMKFPNSKTLANERMASMWTHG